MPTHYNKPLPPLETRVHAIMPSFFLHSLQTPTPAALSVRKTTSKKAVIYYSASAEHYH